MKKKPFPIDRGKMRKEQQGEKALLTAASIICHLERKKYMLTLFLPPSLCDCQLVVLVL